MFELIRIDPSLPPTEYRRTRTDGEAAKKWRPLCDVIDRGIFNDGDVMSNVWACLHGISASDRIAVSPSVSLALTLSPSLSFLGLVSTSLFVILLLLLWPQSAT